MASDKVPREVVDRLLSASTDADEIAQTLITNLDAPLIVARDAVSPSLRLQLQESAARCVGCPHTGNAIFESPRALIVLLGDSVGTCLECLPTIRHRFGRERDGCDFCERQRVTTALVVKDHHAVWFAEICDGCATTVDEAQQHQFGTRATDDPQ